MIKRIMERVSPRIFRVAALPSPTERQKTQLHAQRYIEELPAGGEIVIFDRSWYNRAACRVRDGLLYQGRAQAFSQGLSQLRGLSGQPGHHPAEVLARSIEKGTAQALPRAY